MQEGPAAEGAHEQSATSGRRRAAQDLLVVAALTGIAFAQPVLDLLGNSPSTIQFRGVAGTDVIVFAAAVVLLPPVALWGLAEIARRFDRRIGRGVHLATVAALAAVIGLLVIAGLVSTAPVAVLGALAASGAVTAAYVRFGGVRRWLVLLSGANALVALQFLVLSPAADLVTAADERPPAATFDSAALDADGDPASVVMVVLDELATQSMLAEDETIDEVRFPNLARFASGATWYRHFSTVSPFTQSAVPALLDGQDPRGEPVQADHPDNLFTLLAGSHDLVVSEALTKLCAFEECEGSIRDTQWRGLLDDAVDAWSERVRPGGTSARESYDDFVEDLESVTGDGDGPLTEEEQRSADAFFATAVDAQPSRLTTFVESLRPTDDPFFAFLHLVLPHQPWLLREDGTAYDIPGDADSEPDVATPWEARVSRQRHLLQATYADRLVGVVLDRLHDVGEYEDSLVVVVSDHGVSFEPGQSTRSLTDENLEQIAYSPLLVKAPGQTEAAVDDTNVLSVDVAPTIASILGTTPSWASDGSPAGDAATQASRGDEKYIHDFTDAFSYEFLGIRRFSDDTRYGEMLAGRFPAVTAEDAPSAGLYADQPGAELIGAPASVIRTGGRATEGSIEIRELGSLEQPTSPKLLGTVSGSVPDGQVGDTVVIALNGTIVGVSPLFDNEAGPNQFLVLLPADAMRGDGNEVRVGIIEAGAPVAVARQASPLD